jgi:hypothetical protein
VLRVIPTLDFLRNASIERKLGEQGPTQASIADF